jgi:hypothetical protein
VAATASEGKISGRRWRVNGGLRGVYHHASEKQLGRHINEFTWRLNEGNVKRHSLERLNSFVDAVSGRRLTYEKLIQ